MDYDFDPKKDKSNLAKHGISLAEAENFDWETAIVREDTRRRYAEPRFTAAGLIEERLHVMVFCFRAGNVRVISLRKANSREVKQYAKNS